MSNMTNSILPVFECLTSKVALKHDLLHHFNISRFDIGVQSMFY